MGRMGLMTCLRCRCRRSRSEVRYRAETRVADCVMSCCLGARNHYSSVMKDHQVDFGFLQRICVQDIV